MGAGEWVPAAGEWVPGIHSLPGCRPPRSRPRPIPLLLHQTVIGLEAKKQFEKVGDYQSESENVDEDILRLGSGPHAVEIDLMQPIDPERSPKVHTPTLNHVGLWIDDLPAAVDWLSSQGMRFTPGGIRKGASGYDVCFLHPKGNEESPRSGEGVLIELVQAPDDVVQSLS